MRVMAIILLLFLLVPLFSVPQETNAAVTISSTDLTVTPPAPSPNSPVTIRLTDTTQLPQGTGVLWFVDDVEMTEDQNSTGITVTTKNIGEITKVEARVTSPTQGQSITTVTILPVRLDLIVGANTSVPGFYMGRAIPSSAGKISVSALVFGDKSGPYDYYWTVNGRDEVNRVGGSGQQITIEPSLDHEMNVYVEVYNYQGQLTAQGGTVIPLSQPEIYFYEANPLRGLLPNALRSPYYFLNDEITLRAEPYYFSGTGSDLAIKWQIDGKTTTNEENPLELSLVKTKSEGRSLIDLSIIDTTSFLESATADLILTY